MKMEQRCGKDKVRKGIIIFMAALKVKILKGFKERVVGLLGSKEAFPVLIYTRFGIHTFFLKFPIDVVVLNKKNKVVKISKNLKPNRIFLWNPLLNKIIELPSGEVERNKIKVGGIIKLNET